MQSHISNKTVFIVGPYIKNTPKNRSAVIASTIGYCRLTLHPQLLHLPLNVNKYDNTGILSYHFIGVLQTGHFYEGKTIDSFDNALNATTFKKLPMQAPVINIKKPNTYISSIILPACFLFRIIY